MKTYTSIAFAGVAMATLSACGGASTSTTAPISLPAATFSEGGTPIIYDPAAGTLSVDGNAVNNPRGTALVTNGDATVYRSDASFHYSSIAQNGDAFAVASSSSSAGTDPRAFTYGRRGATELSTTGTATFSGDYAGTFVEDGNQTLFGIVDGDVALTADLANMTLTGDITNRVAYTTSGAIAAAPEAYADAQIVGGTIAADGSFDATVTGGVRTFSGGDYIYVSGAANGTFAGATGETAAGVVQIMQQRPTTLIPRSEIGSFIATRN